MKTRVRSMAVLALLLVGVSATSVHEPDTVFLDELTWIEVRDAIQHGTTTIIVPTAGTEQNGPHMVLGKHKFVVNHAADQIARLAMRSWRQWRPTFQKGI